MPKTLEQIFEEVRQDSGKDFGLKTWLLHIEEDGERVSTESRDLEKDLMKSEFRSAGADPFEFFLDKEYVEIESIDNISISGRTPRYEVELTYRISDFETYRNDQFSITPVSVFLSEIEDPDLVGAAEIRGSLSNYQWRRMAYNGRDYSPVERF